MSLPERRYRRSTVFAWSLYDFANSAFTTLVVTFIYATYFTKVIATDEVTGTGQWSLGVTLTAFVVAILSPFVGAIADRGGYRKRFLLIATIICIAATAVLYFPVSGHVFAALGWFVVANIAFEMGNVFYNAFLPDIAPPEKIGRVSGYGWALGYIGGLLCLVAALFGFVNPDLPLFGFSKEGGANVRATNLLVAAWYALFSIPLFLFVKEQARPRAAVQGGLFRSAARQFVSTFNDIRRYRQIFRFLVARLIYNDGLITIFAFGGIYAAGTFGFETEDIIIFGIALNVSAGIGAFVFGYLDDRLGGKSTILISLAGLFGAGLLAVVATSTVLFWVAAILVGLLSGPNQSASRSLMGRFVPPDKENEFFGFFAFSGKFTAFLGPFLLGRFTTLFGTQRAGMAVVLFFFMVGGFLLFRVDEAEGVALGQAVTAPPASTPQAGESHA